MPVRIPSVYRPLAYAKTVSTYFIVFQVGQFSLFQFAIEGYPLLTQFGRKCIKLAIDRLAQKWDIHLCEYIALSSMDTSSSEKWRCCKLSSM